jgi:hypothetical protein
MTGAQIFCALRTYLATAARHGISALDALTRAAEGDPWIPEIQPSPDNRHPCPQPATQRTAGITAVRGPI